VTVSKKPHDAASLKMLLSLKVLSPVHTPRVAVEALLRGNAVAATATRLPRGNARQITCK